jgi:methylenetetrahydrofolate reductase (NADPH)
MFQANTMSKPDSNQEVLALLLDQAYLEVFPTKTIADRLVHIPRHGLVGISCSPTHGLEPTIALVEQLKAQPHEDQLKVIPHIAARMIRDKGHLKETLSRLEVAGVERVFIVGGDAKHPIGKYSDSLQLLKDMADIGHNFKDVGVAAYPEGHPLINGQELTRFLQEKQSLATYMVTQMCFDPQSIVNWLTSARQAGVKLPVWIGLPGVADLTKLIPLSFRIGVGQSLKMLKKQKGLLRKLVSARPYQPDELLQGLQPHLGNADLLIEGFHIFSFNAVERTEKWRMETYNNLSR